MKKILTIVVAVALLTLAACGGNSSDADNKGKSKKKDEISILFGKEEVMKQFENAVKEFEEEKDVKVSIIPLAGTNAYEKMTTLYSSGNAPTIMMVAQEFEEFQDRLADLSDEPWMDTVQEGMMDFVTVDGKAYGQPATVEAFGFIYNKDVLDEAVGGDFDPKTVQTHDEFEDLLKKIDALDDVDAIHISPMDWSLGAHFTNPMFAAQSEDRDERHQFLADMLAGDISLDDNDVFNGWLKTLDLMKEYNSAKSSPLSPQYDDGPLALANGEVGLWFMGNWAYPELAEVDPDVEYGFLPVPVGNDASDFGNNQISVGVPSYWVVDESQSTEDQQKIAKEFLDWMVSSEQGQKHYVEELNFIPVFDGFAVKPEDSVSLSVMNYMEEEETLEWMNSYYPSDSFPSMGATLQKYISDNIDRDGLIDELEAYWESAGK